MVRAETTAVDRRAKSPNGQTFYAIAVIGARSASRVALAPLDPGRQSKSSRRKVKKRPLNFGQVRLGGSLLVVLV